MRMIKFFALILFVAAAGCGGKDDLNKDLKPVGKDAPKPTAAGATPGGANKAATPSITPPASPP